MFEGESADTCAGKISAHVNGGPSGGSSVRRPGTEDPHRHERNSITFGNSNRVCWQLYPVKVTRMSSKIKSSHSMEDGTTSHWDVLKIAVTSFYHSTLAKQDYGFSWREHGKVTIVRNWETATDWGNNYLKHGFCNRVQIYSLGTENIFPMFFKDYEL